jgi:hypothetical protein
MKPNFEPKRNNAFIKEMAPWDGNFTTKNTNLGLEVQIGADKDKILSSISQNIPRTTCRGPQTSKPFTLPIQVHILVGCTILNLARSRAFSTQLYKRHDPAHITEM